MSLYRVDSPPQLFRHEMGQQNYQFVHVGGGLSPWGIVEQLDDDSDNNKLIEQRGSRRQTQMDAATHLESGNENHVRDAHLNSVIDSLSKFRMLESASTSCSTSLPPDLCQLLSQIGADNNNPNYTQYRINPEGYSPRESAGIKQNATDLGSPQYTNVSRQYTMADGRNILPSGFPRPLTFGGANAVVNHGGPLTFINGNNVVASAQHSPSPENGELQHIYSSPCLLQPVCFMFTLWFACIVICNLVQHFEQEICSNYYDYFLQIYIQFIHQHSTR